MRSGCFTARSASEVESFTARSASEVEPFTARSASFDVAHLYCVWNPPVFQRRSRGRWVQYWGRSGGSTGSFALRWVLAHRDLVIHSTGHAKHICT